MSRHSRCDKCDARFWTDIPCNKWCGTCWLEIVGNIQKTACAWCGRSYDTNIEVKYQGKKGLMCNVCQYEFDVEVPVL